MVVEIAASIFTVLSGFANSLIDLSPKLLGAFVILLIGWIVGSIVGRVIKGVAKRYKVDLRVFRTEQSQIKLSYILAVITSWAIYLIFIQSAVEILGIVSLVTIIGSILIFLGGLLQGTVIIIVGYIVAHYVSENVRNSKVIYSDIMAGFLFFIIIYVSVALALPLIGIDPTLVNSILLILVGAVGIGIAIALGFGLKDIVAEASRKHLRKHLKLK